VARHYGADVPFLRPSTISGDKSPDIEWVIWMLNALKDQGHAYELFSILRPTNPLRLPETIRRACALFIEDGNADSLRAVDICKQHPGKMWVIRGRRMLPIMPFNLGSTPWHSSQYATLPEIYAQNASLEIAWSRLALETGSIAGESIIPFVSEGLEGFDINERVDWVLAEYFLNNGDARLPMIKNPPFQFPE
jgi:CMP-N,N'-diacetyllegionaminic acid synthase